MAVCPGSWHAVWVMCICTPRPAMGHPAHPAHRDLDGARALSATIFHEFSSLPAGRRQDPTDPVSPTNRRLDRTP